MIRKSLALFAVLFAGTVSAYSQAAMYGTFNVERMGNIKSTPLSSAARQVTQPLKDSVDPIGGTFGVYYDFRNLGPARLGIDARFTEQTAKRGALADSQGSGVRIYSGLAGLRASFHTPYAPLKPYVQASAGLGRTDYGIGGGNETSSPAVGGVKLVNNFEYHVFAGADLHILPFVDFRAVEVGYGGLNPFGTNSHNYSLYSLSTGVVIHFSK